MDRERTPQKQRQKRSGGRRNSSSSSGIRASVGASTSGTNGANAASTRAFRGTSTPGSARPRSRTAAAAPTPPNAILAKPPTILRAPASSTTSSRGLQSLQPPTEPTRGRKTDQRDSYLQVNTRLSTTGGPRPASPPERRGSLRIPPSAMSPSSASSASKVSLPTSSVKLITPQMQFATDLSVTLGSCLDLAHFTVVGVLGLEGVGKSTVLSLLADKPTPLFVAQSLETRARGGHETNGIDLGVTLAGGAGHPTVLLDSQPLLSASLLTDLLQRNESPRFGVLSPEQQVDVASYQLAVFLCAICHYVVVVHDGLACRLEVTALLRQLERKLAMCRLPSVSGVHEPRRHAAKMLFVANGVSDAELLYRENELLSAHERALEAAWPHAFLRVPCELSHYCEPDSDNSNGDMHAAAFILPRKMTTRKTKANASSGSKKTKERSANQRHGDGKYEDYDDAAARLRQFVLSLPSSPSFTTASPSAGASKLHALTLREWLSNASRVFEAVRKSSSFTAEYASSRDHH